MTKVNLIGVFTSSIAIVTIELEDTTIIIKTIQNGIENKGKIKVKYDSVEEAEKIYTKKLNDYFNDGYTTIELPFIDDICNFPQAFKTITKE